MHDRKHVMGTVFSFFAIIFGVGCLLLLLLDTSDNVATLPMLKAENEADKRSTGSLPGPPPKNVTATDGREVVARANESLPIPSNKSLVLEAEHEAHLAVNETLPPRRNEGFSLLTEREVELRANKRLPRRPSEPRATDAERKFDGRMKVNQTTQSESVAERVNEPLLSPHSIVESTNNVVERTVLDFDGQTDLASPSEQSGLVRSPSPREPHASLENQVSPVPETTPAGTIVTEQEARLALQGVGSDPISEMVWIAAINDPDLSPNVRQNLIEDLNEDGFPDFRNITVDDLPLIMTRMALIEDMFFDAMDDANAEAFLEAYKDLENMYGRLTNW